MEQHPDTSEEGSTRGSRTDPASRGARGGDSRNNRTSSKNGATIDTVLVPVDVSEHAQRAAAHAIALAQREGATLHALYVVDTREMGEPALSSMEIVIEERKERGWKVLAAVAETAERHGVPVETICCHGDPADEIRAVADEIDSDLIIVGKRGETHEHRGGTVTRELLREDDRVVVV
ncbi:universal stress protein [Halapricum hydrolyticum]|uniref:Universal stress protein n=1 Tax=Halapricum hydrolyticum TaxID=2979991 RepID=A0AAE3IAR9_9EURY|nr:universal stress protein [Halapricum hydrolyticum]MCU4719662.1 universal stress protein [Halapricum hydrolyticum]MCU4726309.1 universal stress protein [Halapricum hydrolyticum]